MKIAPVESRFNNPIDSRPNIPCNSHVYCLPSQFEAKACDAQYLSYCHTDRDFTLQLIEGLRLCHLACACRNTTASLQLLACTHLPWGTPPVRMPDIKVAMNVAEGTLGLSLLGLPLGTLLTLTFAAPILERIGFRQSLLVIMPLVSIIYAIAAHATNPAVFFLLLIPIGMSIGCIEIVINVEADRTEAVIGRRIMNRAHAFWSFGFFGAGIFGAVMGQLVLSPQIHLALIAPISLAAILLLLGDFQPAPTRVDESDGKKPKFAKRTGAIMVLVGVSLSAMLLEGAGIDWSAIYMRNIFSSGPFVAGFAVAIVALAQALTRLVVDSYIDKYSPARIARVLLWILAAGVVCVVTKISPIVSLIGFALIGIGCSAIFPMAVSAAAQRTDRSSAVNVAAFV